MDSDLILVDALIFAGAVAGAFGLLHFPMLWLLDRFQRGQGGDDDGQ